ncbi:unnamed protein product, partial [Iphiclides podalirius]
MLQRVVPVKTLNSAEFRVPIADTLWKRKTVNYSIKRKSDTECLIQDKKKGLAEHDLPKDVRLRIFDDALGKGRAVKRRETIELRQRCDEAGSSSNP